MTELPIRVTVLDTWDEYGFSLPADTPAAEVKRRALAAARVTRAPTTYLVKFRGAEVLDESATLADLGVAPNAPLIVLPRRRLPAR